LPDETAEYIVKYSTKTGPVAESTDSPSTSELRKLADEVLSRIEVFLDFPAPGVAFQDLGPVFADQRLLERIARAIAIHFAGKFDTVLAVEARGFILGTAVAQLTGCQLALARKPGKLPGPVHTVSYELEYGKANLEVQQNIFDRVPRTLIVDDVLATGGTVCAAAELVNRGGGQVVGCALVLAIATLSGLSRLEPFDVFTLLTI
jgi:adenine phosphoribosyltransferase